MIGTTEEHAELAAAVHELVPGPLLSLTVAGLVVGPDSDGVPPCSSSSSAGLPMSCRVAAGWRDFRRAFRAGDYLVVGSPPT